MGKGWGESCEGKEGGRDMGERKRMGEVVEERMGEMWCERMGDRVVGKNGRGWRRGDGGAWGLEENDRREVRGE